jgi:hypothetical protein
MSDVNVHPLIGIPPPITNSCSLWSLILTHAPVRFPASYRELVRLPTLGSRPLTRPPHTDRQGLPIEERKAKLEALLKKRPKILRNYSDLNFRNEAGSFHCKERRSQSDSSFNIR